MKRATDDDLSAAKPMLPKSRLSQFGSWLLQWSTLFAIRDCRQLLPPMSPMIQVSY